MLVDTGGVDIADRRPLTQAIAVQARAGIEEADLVLFVVDARAGVTPGDEEVAQILRESRKPVLVLANKIDDPRDEPLILELHKLGLGDPIPISGLHGVGAGDLLDTIDRGASSGLRLRAARSCPTMRFASRFSAGRPSASRVSSTRSSAASA